MPTARSSLNARSLYAFYANLGEPRRTSAFEWSVLSLGPSY